MISKIISVLIVGFILGGCTPAAVPASSPAAPVQSALPSQPPVAESSTATLSPVPTIAVISTATLAQVRIAAVKGNLFIRRGPDVAFNPIAVLTQGQSEAAFARDVLGTWVEIPLPDNSQMAGWVSIQTQYSAVTGDIMRLPEIQPTDWPILASLRNCTFHQMVTDPGGIIIPSADNFPANEVNVNPGIYRILDTDVDGYPEVLKVEIREDPPLTFERMAMATSANAPYRSPHTRHISIISGWDLMQKKLLPLILAAILLTSCQMRLANRALGGGAPSATLSTPTGTEVQLLTKPPAATPLPPPTIRPSVAPDPSVVGLPAEAMGATALDFATDVCKAVWSNGNGDVICDANDPASSTGYVMLMNGERQGLPSDIPVLLMYPPQDNGDTLSGKYPAFTVQKGDRFRAVLACRIHTFCDVDFGLDYFDSNGRTGLAHWSYLFTDEPRIVDYSLDGIAGRTVQFGLVVRRHGAGPQAYAVWIMAHIYRPLP